MSPSTSLETDAPRKDVDEKLYRGMIGSLLYLTASRLNMFSVCKCALFQSASKESHLTAVERIIRYLIRFQDLGLWCPHTNKFDLFGYPNVDFIGDKTNHKSTVALVKSLEKLSFLGVAINKHRWLFPTLRKNI